MKKGEKALLTIKPEYGYGAQGSPPTIPANATLQFEVQLLSWHSVKDITPAKDGGIIKTTITEGEGWATPKNDDEVLGESMLQSAELWMWTLLTYSLLIMSLCSAACILN